MRARGIEDSKLRHPTTLSQRQGHTPKSSTPISSQQECFPAPPLSLTTVSRLPTISAFHDWLLSLWNEFRDAKRLPATVSTRCLSVCQDQPIEIQAIQERVGYIPAGSSDWGRGVSSCYTFCESAHKEGKGKQSRPTHQSKLVNRALLPTLLSLYSYTCTLSYLPKIHSRPFHQEFPGHPIVLNPPALRRETSLSL